jgi:hypothetical protein
MLVDGDSAFTEYDATSLRKPIQTFRSNTVSSSSRVPADAASCTRGAVSLREPGNSDVSALVSLTHLLTR